MSKHVLALLAALLLLMGLGAGTAAAQAPTQVAGQTAGSEQSASSDANATQVAPSNRNVDVRIFSPGDSGAVNQTNAAGAAAVAAPKPIRSRRAASNASTFLLIASPVEWFDGSLRRDPSGAPLRTVAGVSRAVRASRRAA